MEAKYPAREKGFSFRFCRRMAKVCLANEIGAAACWLLTTIVNTEDAKSYRGAVTYFNEQLVPIAGVQSVKALRTIRDKCVEAGWLHYEAGGKGKAGKYWVMVPEWADNPADNGPCDESDDEEFTRQKSPQQVPEKCPESGPRSAREVPEKCPTMGTHSSLSLPYPFPCAVKPEEQTKTIAAFLGTEWQTYHRGAALSQKGEREAAAEFEEWIEKLGADPVVMLEEIRNKSRDRTEPLHEFKKRVTPKKHDKPKGTYAEKAAKTQQYIAAQKARDAGAEQK